MTEDGKLAFTIYTGSDRVRITLTGGGSDTCVFELSPVDARRFFRQGAAITAPNPNTLFGQWLRQRRFNRATRL